MQVQAVNLSLEDYGAYVILSLPVGENTLETLYANIDEEIDMSEEAIPTDMIKLIINTLNLDSITSEEQALEYYTRKKLKRLSTWNE